VWRQGIREGRENSSENSLMMVNSYTDTCNRLAFFEATGVNENFPCGDSRSARCLSLDVFSRNERTTMTVNLLPLK